MIKKLSFLLICVHILCAENFAESSTNYNNLDSAVNSLDSAPFAESSAESTQNAIVDSAKSTNPPPPPSRKMQNLKAYLSDISPKIPHLGINKTPFD